MKYRAITLSLVTLLLAFPAFPYVVNSTDDGADQNPGDNVCATSGGACTLRAAIQEANAHVGGDLITFSVQGIINPATQFPAITEPVAIDGTTAPSYDANPAPIGTPSVIVNDTTGLVTGLTFAAGSTGSSVRGIRVTGFRSTNISISSNSVSVQNCWLLGADDGTTNGDGLALFGASAIIGGTGRGNLISGNRRFGILAAGASHLFVANWIGIGINGTSAYENGDDGIHIFAGGSAMVVGPNANGDGNVISGNLGDGIEIDGGGEILIVNNRIGTDFGGTIALGNGGAGVRINNAGAIDVGPQNIIANNGGAGVAVTNSAVNVTVDGNSIHSNAGLGIDLAENGIVDPNDAGDTDTGANNLMNSPVITSVVAGTVNGTMSTTAGQAVVVRVYSNGAGDSSSSLEGRTYLGQTAFTTDGSGFGGWTYSNASITPGSLLSVTATAAGNTSEFAEVAVAAPLPVVEFNAASWAIAESGPVASILLNRTGDLTGTSTVQFATSAGTAAAGSDYVTTSNTVTFGPGVASMTITIPIVNDLADEPTEQFSVVLSSPAGATLGTISTATVSITDDDPATVAPAAVPALSQWGLLVLGLMLAGFAAVKLGH